MSSKLQWSNVMSLARLVVLALLGSCVAPPSPPTLPPVAPLVTAQHPADLAGAALYQIDPPRSKLHILVYRAGTMAQLGHNHVVSSEALTGYVWLHENLPQSGFDLVLPVNELIMDEPQSRTEEGAEFPLNVSEEGRVATKRNMLLPTALDGEHYPVIRLQSVAIAGTRAQPMLSVRITIKDQSRVVNVPASLQVSGNTLHASGQFSIRQTDFGLVPQSAMLGALLVQDQLTLKFDLQALRI